MKFKKGFTLIELLVVVSIIGLMTSVALASLSAAREKAANSNIKSNLGQVLREAALIYSNTGSYNGLFNSGSPALTAFRAAQTTAGAGAGAGSCVNDQFCTDEWYAYVQLKPLDSVQFWCVDYKNVSMLLGFDPSGAAYSDGGCMGFAN